VIVDFAHTPDGLEQFLSAVRCGMTPGAQLRVVLGFAARPGTALRELGRLARALSDQLILTTCGFEGIPPLPCLSEMLRGARTAHGGEMDVILDRRRAIGRAIRSAAVGDAVVIPGRGALPDMLNDRRGIAVPFDDREAAREILNELAATRRLGRRESD
jgi:UDP-N-acetylmuramyl tripeptide synthase